MFLNSKLLYNFYKLNKISFNYKHVISSKFIKHFSQTNIYFKKIFIDSENLHAHEIFSSTRGYILSENIINNKKKELNEYEINTSCNKNKLMDITNNEEIVNTFENIACYCNQKNIFISDERFDPLIDILAERCPDFTDDQIIRILKHLQIFPETESINQRNFVELWTALDTSCVERIKNWNYEKLLYVADHWYYLHLAKVSDYCSKMLRKLERKLHKVPPQQLVQTMFFVNLKRKKIIDMFLFERNLAKCIDDLKIGEIGIMCMGFFKTETKIHNPYLVTQIYQRTILEVETIADITLVNILKALRYSSQLSHIDIMIVLLDSLVKQIPRLSLLSCLHIALTGTDVQLCHEKSLTLIVDRFLNDINKLRLKELERISFVIGLHDFSNKGNAKLLCEKILMEIKKRVPEIMRHPKCLPSCAHFLTLSGIYSEELISACLDDKFLETTYGKHIILSGREIFFLDSFHRINLRGRYKGNQLTQQERKKLAKMFTFNFPQDTKVKLSVTERLQLNIQEYCDILYKKNSTLPVLTLPHFERADLLMAFNAKTKKPIQINKKLFNADDFLGDILTPDFFINKLELMNENLKLLLIVIGGWNSFMRDKPNQPTGLLKLKLNQIEILGFNPVLVSFFEWNLLNKDAKLTLLQNKIDSVLCK